MSLKLTSVFLALLGSTVCQNAHVPVLKTDFKKGDAPAQWAKGHPKEWGSEDFRIDTTGVITPDEKYLVNFNNTHANFIDLDGDVKTPIATIGFEVPKGYYSPGSIVRPAPEGGFDLIVNVRINGAPYTSGFFRRRVSADLKPVGNTTFYETGLIGSLASKSKAATSDGHIFDLDDPTYDIKLQDPLRDTYDFSFSSDGRFLSVTGIGGAQLYNATSGEILFRYPVPADFANWNGAIISPDDKYVAVISDGLTPLQVYSMANLDAAPISISDISRYRFAGSLAWSPDSKYIATGDGGRVRVWSIPEGKVVNAWEPEEPKAEWPNNQFSVGMFGWIDNG